MTGKHTLIMLLCCLIPLAAIFAVTVLGVPVSGLGTVATITRVRRPSTRRPALVKPPPKSSDES